MARTYLHHQAFEQLEEFFFTGFALFRHSITEDQLIALGIVKPQIIQDVEESLVHGLVLLEITE